MSDDPFSDENFFGGSKKKADTNVAPSDDLRTKNPFGHFLQVVAEQATHVVPDTLGAAGDLAYDVGQTAKYRYQHGFDKTRVTGLAIPGAGPVSQKAAAGYQALEEKVLGKGGVPVARNTAERYGGTASRMAANFMTGGGNLKLAAKLGAAGGLLQQGAQDYAPENEALQLAATVLPAVLHGGVSAAGKRMAAAAHIRNGARHPDFDSVISTIIKQERGGTFEHPKVNAKSGATGPMQVTMETARDPGYHIKPWNGKTQADLARVGTQKAAAMMSKYDGDVDKVLAAYNWGEGNVDHAIKVAGNDWLHNGRGVHGQPVPLETKNYVVNGIKNMGRNVEGHEAVLAPQNAEAAAAATREAPVPAPDAGLPPEQVAANESIMAKADNNEDPFAKAPEDTGNVVNSEDRFSEKGRREDQAGIDDSLAMANKIHQGIDEGVITADHLPRIEEARAGVEKVLASGTETLDRNQMDLLRQNHNMLDDAVVKLGGESSIADGAAPKPAVAGQEYALPESEPNTAAGNDNVPPEGPPPGDGGGAPPPEERLGVFERLKAALTTAEPGLKDQGAARTAERVIRNQEAAKARATLKGEDLHNAMRGAQKGELPSTDFNSIREQFTPEEIADLKTHIGTHKDLHGVYEPMKAMDGLDKMLDGRLPQDNELKLLYKVLPKDLMDELMKKRKLSTADKVSNILNLPRGIMSSFDLSAPGRQGMFLVGRKAYWTSMDDMFKGAVTDAKADAIHQTILDHPDFPLIKDRINLTDRHGFLGNREEAFMSPYAEKMPGETIPVVGLLSKTYNKTIGQVVSMSDRAYTTYLNKLRADHAFGIIEHMRNTGTELSPKVLDGLADYINTATGRGGLGKFADSSRLLNGVLFSPQLIASRLKLMNPLWYAKLPAPVRVEALKSLASFGAITGSVIGLAAAGGAAVSTDWTSTDFMKIKVGNTRFEVTGGIQPYVRMLGEMVLNHKVDQDGHVQEFGKTTFSKSRGSELLHFGRGKLAPVASFVVDGMTGSDYTGKKFEVGSALANRLKPMITNDIEDAYKDMGAKGLLVAVPSAFGIGVTTFTKDRPQAAAPASAESEDPFSDANFYGKTK